MSAFGDWAEKRRLQGSPLGVGLTITVILLAIWNLIVFALIIVPVMLFAAVAARTVWWLESRKVNRRHGSPVIEGQYEVLDPEGGTT